VVDVDRVLCRSAFFHQDQVTARGAPLAIVAVAVVSGTIVAEHKVAPAAVWALSCTPRWRQTENVLVRAAAPVGFGRATGHCYQGPRRKGAFLVFVFSPRLQRPQQWLQRLWSPGPGWKSPKKHPRASWRLASGGYPRFDRALTLQRSWLR
jgi:hypothetical protein